MTHISSLNKEENIAISFIDKKGDGLNCLIQCYIESDIIERVIIN